MHALGEGIFVAGDNAQIMFGHTLGPWKVVADVVGWSVDETAAPEPRVPLLVCCIERQCRFCVDGFSRPVTAHTCHCDK